LIHHKLFNYRGVIVDVDPCFLGDADWYEQMAKSRPPKDRPWYRILVDQSEHETYVAERNLESDDSGRPVDHPVIWNFFDEFLNGCYVTHRRVN
jgi:heat shock protein HspQ